MKLTKPQIHSNLLSTEKNAWIKIITRRTSVYSPFYS